MREAYATPAFLAAHTNRVKLLALAKAVFIPLSRFAGRSRGVARVRLQGELPEFGATKLEGILEDRMVRLTRARPGSASSRI